MELKLNCRYLKITLAHSLRLFLIWLIFCGSIGTATVTEHFVSGTADAFSGSNKWIWLGGSALTLVAFKYDNDIYLHYAKKEKEELPDSIGDTMGTGIPGAAIALLTMGYGWARGNSQVVEAGQSHGEALFATLIYTSILKAAVERDRPPAYSGTESEFNASFPSGHTSTAFATAGSMMAAGGPWVGVPFLALAAVTGYSRIQQRVHYTGDVMFGATLGYTMGAGFYQHHKTKSYMSLQVYPYFENRNSWGMVTQIAF